MGIFTNAIAIHEDVLNYIPQRPPMVMVDAFYSMEDGDRIAHTGLNIVPNNIFVKAGTFYEGGILEHVAQSAALRMGYLSQKQGNEVKVGYIGSFDKVHIYKLPHVGEQLHTSITVECDMGALIMLSFQVNVDDKKIAEGRVKVALKQ